MISETVHFHFHLQPFRVTKETAVNSDISYSNEWKANSDYAV